MRYLFQLDKDDAPNIEDALNVLEQNLISTLEACSFGIILFDMDGDFIGMNRRWKELYLLDFEQMKDYNILNDSNLRTKHIWQSIENSFKGEPGVVDDNYFTPEEWDKPGRGRWTKGHALPLFQKDRRQELQIAQAVVLEDVTQTKVLESEVLRLTAQIEELQAAQANLYKTLSMLHEKERDDNLARPKLMPTAQQLHQQIPQIPRREREVFEKLAAGWSVKETAHQLQLGIKSVYTYRARLLKRLKLAGDVELAIAWREIQQFPKSFKP